MTDFIYNSPNRKETRKKLRKDSTPQEILVWARLRNNNIGFKFKRQYSVGGYIIDFYCPSKRLGVEIDGSQHLENKEYDAIRTKLFNDLKIKIVRFWNNEVNKNIDSVIQKIITELNSPSPM